jgi:FlaA1/EpsC-like NDP-sugar epimerase
MSITDVRPQVATQRSGPGTPLAASLTADNLLGFPADASPDYGAEARELIEGARVLVTGAGGSIGSELVHQLRALHAAAVICVDRDEYGLYRLELDQTGQALLADDALVLADVTSRTQMDRVFAVHRPGLVFHAAAVKHLPLAERSPAEAIRVNVGGTATVATLCAEHRVHRLVNVSTDKAADPVSVLGQTKRLAEIAALGSGSTVAASVRFGNVFNSRGSFIETLTHQITRDLPVTLTDRRMYRYFMTIPQAAGLVIEAAVLADGRSTYILDMGDPYRVETIVRTYAGLVRPDTDPDIAYAGVRPGEKLAEVLGGRAETPRPTAHPRISAVRVLEASGATAGEIAALLTAAENGEPPELLRKQLAGLTMTEVS